MATDMMAFTIASTRIFSKENVPQRRVRFTFRDACGVL